MCSSITSKLNLFKRQCKHWVFSKEFGVLIAVIGLLIAIYQLAFDNTEESIDALLTTQIESKDTLQTSIENLSSAIVPTGVPTRTQLKAILSEAKNDFSGLTPNVLRRHFHRQFSEEFRSNSVSYYRALALAHFENGQFSEALEILTEGLNCISSDQI